jgi:hypothetical protein
MANRTPDRFVPHGPELSSGLRLITVRFSESFQQKT